MVLPTLEEKTQFSSKGGKGGKEDKEGKGSKGGKGGKGGRVDCGYAANVAQKVCVEMKHWLADRVCSQMNVHLGGKHFALKNPAISTARLVVLGIHIYKRSGAPDAIAAVMG